MAGSESSSLGSALAVIALIAVGAATFVLYLWMTDDRKAKQKFAKNEGPTKVPDDLKDVKSSDVSFRNFMDAMTAVSPTENSRKTQKEGEAKEDIQSPTLSIKSNPNEISMDEPDAQGRNVSVTS
ncbi:hypothetical protein Q1695_003665 [Nippostrongylus brasiliensis]|nr:hypothetical protein Q1695_003665 [Nippostrongylus brasiliensis]